MIKNKPVVILYETRSLNNAACLTNGRCIKVKKEGKDQESMQSS